jgi:hypothetical protein
MVTILRVWVMPTWTRWLQTWMPPREDPSAGPGPGRWWGGHAIAEVTGWRVEELRIALSLRRRSSESKQLRETVLVLSRR